MATLLYIIFYSRLLKCQPNWTSENFISNQIRTIRKLVGSNQVLVGVSGGVDSSVVAALVRKAVGDRMNAVLIDHGLMRKMKRRNAENFLKMA